MSPCIIDASVAAKWYFTEEHSDQALSILQTIKSFHAPEFFLLEMDNILCKRINRKEIKTGDAEQARETFRKLPIKLYPFTPLHDPAFAIALLTGVSIYDSLYLALASSLEGVMITADAKLLKKIQKGPFTDNIVWIENAV